MEVYLNRIDGIDDAIVSMFQSKRTITPELEHSIRTEVLDCSFQSYGSKGTQGAIEYMSDSLNDWLKKLLKWGTKHITMLKFIDLSFTVYGLHRGGQDDLDSHAKRMDNRIIRSSTRLADFHPGEKSEFYMDKIITTDEALEILEIALPDTIIHGGEEYVRATNGYIKRGMENDKDVKRGLYMLSIPSSFIFRVNLSEFAHIYKMRNMNTSANPEVKQAVEMMAQQLNDATMGYISQTVLMQIEN